MPINNPSNVGGLATDGSTTGATAQEQQFTKSTRAAAFNQYDPTKHPEASDIGPALAAQNQDFPAQDDRVKRDLIVGRNISAVGALNAGAVAGTDEHNLVGGLAVTETDASRAAGSFNQAGAARGIESKDSNTLTWYTADGGGQVDVPQAGGFAVLEGLQGVDNTNTGFHRRRQYLNAMWHNIGNTDGAQNRDFLISWT